MFCWCTTHKNKTSELIFFVIKRKKSKAIKISVNLSNVSLNFACHNNALFISIFSKPTLKEADNKWPIGFDTYLRFL